MLPNAEKERSLNDFLVSQPVKTKRNAAANLRTFLGGSSAAGRFDHVPDFPTVLVDEYLPMIIDPGPPGSDR
jgi:hypothetical protein